MHDRQYYGLWIRSAFKLPGGARPTSSNGRGSVDIYAEHASKPLVEFAGVGLVARRHSGWFRAYDVEHGVLICVHEFLQVYISKAGTRIKVFVLPSHIDYAPVYITGLALSIAMMYRGILPLHAASLELGNRFIGIMAPSGTGKTTLVWNMVEKGARFGSDDVLPVDALGENPMGRPSGMLPSKMWLDTLQRFQLEMGKCAEIVPGIGKYWVPVNERQRVERARELNALFLLTPNESLHAETSDVQIMQVTGVDAFATLLNNTHTIWCAPKELQRQMMALYASLISKVPVYEVSYQRNYRNLASIAEAIKRYIL